MHAQRLIVFFGVLCSFSSTAQAQMVRPPDYISPEVTEERSIIFRLFAPKAESVRLVSGDMTTIDGGITLNKDDRGVWEATVKPLPAGAYRYTFNVDGTMVLDVRNPMTSASNSVISSMVVVPGSEVMDLKDVPQGTVAPVTYFSKTLQRFRRMHVYTPPGYEKGEGTYPVLYLLHGATDSDESWSTVGRAGVILDNLIAAGRAKPMIVVMPDGHTGRFKFTPPGDGAFERQIDDFISDFVNDVKPYAESHYRVIGDRAHCAIAGLSMGGIQSLTIATAHLNEYGYLGVFSSGVLGITGGFGAPPDRRWEERYRDQLDNAEVRKGLRLVWFATGKKDFLLKTSQATVQMLKDHGLDVQYKETEGAHTWLNWRDYLIEFAPLLFQDP